jgi:hypothetical protein
VALSADAGDQAGGAASPDDSQSDSYSLVLSAAPGLAAAALSPVASAPPAVAESAGVATPVPTPMPISTPTATPAPTVAFVESNEATVALPPESVVAEATAAPPLADSGLPGSGPVAAMPGSGPLAAAPAVASSITVAPSPLETGGGSFGVAAFLDEEPPQKLATDAMAALSSISGPRPPASAAWFAADTAGWLSGKIERGSPAAAFDAVLESWSSEATRPPPVRGQGDFWRSKAAGPYRSLSR